MPIQLDRVEGEAAVDPATMHGAVRHLSQREREILVWMSHGKSAGEIAAIAGISPATVMFHYRKVADRIGTVNRTHTVAELLRHGDID